MNFLDRLTKILPPVCAIIYLVLTFYRPPLPAVDRILPAILSQEPVQTPTTAQPYQRRFGDFTYTITPHANYELYGLVVSEYDAQNWIDFAHRADPANSKDLCVVWGKNITTQAYQRVSYHSGEFTCFYQWDRPFEPPFANEAFSNNHLVPATPELARAIKSARVGDQVHVRGQLVDYAVQTPNGWSSGTRRTSTIRTDTENGACEIIFATDFTILKAGHPVLVWLRTASLWVGVLSVIGWFAFGLLPLTRRTGNT